MHMIRSWLYIGKFSDTLNICQLSAFNISAMLQMAELVQQPGINCLYLAIEDGQPIPPAALRQGLDFVHSEKNNGGVVLVSCGAGQSRSVVFTVAALKESEGIGLLEALQIVKQRHPEAMPHPALWVSLCRYFQEDVPIQKMMQVAWIGK